ncbi:MAG: hypothetical protein M3Q71_21245 [Chloroflexota bacterium]|nr:hypothetical protein [Chloroflexota bacterium]
MDRPRVLVAIEPYSYREALASAICELRPRFLVHPVEPADLDTLVAATRPAFVVCNRLSPVVRTHAGAWLLLSPLGEDRAILGAGGREQSLPSTDLAAVVTALDAALDQVAPLHDVNADPGAPRVAGPTR